MFMVSSIKTNPRFIHKERRGYILLEGNQIDNVDKRNKSRTREHTALFVFTHRWWLSPL